MNAGKKSLFDILFLLFVCFGVLGIAHALTPKRPNSTRPRHISWALHDAADSALESEGTQPLPRPVLASLLSQETVCGREPLNRLSDRMSRVVASSRLLIELGPLRLMHAGGEEPVALL
jgi:hypothetical protein